jgi:hypothetical protein
VSTRKLLGWQFPPQSSANNGLCSRLSVKRRQTKKNPLDGDRSEASAIPHALTHVRARSTTLSQPLSMGALHASAAAAAVDMPFMHTLL